MRPSRAYPEMLARTILTPGAEKVIEEIFTVGGVECEYVAFGRTAPATAWCDYVMLTLQLDLGTPVAYRSGDQVVTGPPARTMIAADGLYVLMGQDRQDACKQQLRDAFAA